MIIDNDDKRSYLHGYQSAIEDLNKEVQKHRETNRRDFDTSKPTAYEMGFQHAINLLCNTYNDLEFALFREWLYRNGE